MKNVIDEYTHSWFGSIMIPSILPVDNDAWDKVYLYMERAIWDGARRGAGFGLLKERVRHKVGAYLIYSLTFSGESL